MKKILFIFFGLILSVSIKAQKDSLQYYMLIAAKNNPDVSAQYKTYLAAIQKIAPAGALSDPEVQLGFYLKPMELVNGKQVATVSLMQMFPWFGALKAAKSEMTWMAESSYQKFRESSLNIIYQTQAQWYKMVSIRAQIQAIQQNLSLLKSFKEITLYKYKSPSNSSKPSTFSSIGGNTSITSPSQDESMSGMNRNSYAPAVSKTNMNMQGTSMNTEMKSSPKMSDLLRLQTEEANLQEQMISINTEYDLAIELFNILLHRNKNIPIEVPDSLTMQLLDTNPDTWQKIIAQDPMLAMWKAEEESYEAQKTMTKKMSYPMIGIGLQYMINKKKDMTNVSNMNSSTDNMNGMNMVMPMIKVSLPIFRKKYKAQIKEAELMKQSAQLNYSSETDRLQSQYLSIIQRAEDAIRKIKLYNKQVEILQTTLQLLYHEYTTGQSSMTDILNTEKELINYKLEKVEMLGTYNTIVAEYDKLTAKNDYMNIKRN